MTSRSVQLTSYAIAGASQDALVNGSFTANIGPMELSGVFLNDRIGRAKVTALHEGDGASALRVG
jgi:hypothetical protein